MSKKYFATTEVKAINEEDRILRFTASTEDQDRDGDIITVDGWDLKNYLKNPVVLFGHNYWDLPVGKTVNIQKDNVNKRLVHDVKFPTKDEYEFADTVYRLAKSGYLNTVSVGFQGKESVPIYDDGATEYNGKNRYVGRKYIKQELLEISIVPVPANPQALQEAKSKGLINDDEQKSLEGYMQKHIQEKAGATLSAKTKKELGEICDSIRGCGDRLRKFLDEFEPMESEDGEEGKGKDAEPTASKLIAQATIGDELKEVLADIKQALFNLQEKEAVEPEPDPDEAETEDSSSEPETTEIEEPATEEEAPETEDEIDLDAIEDPDEIDIDEEELDKALSHLIDSKINKITGGKST